MAKTTVMRKLKLVAVLTVLFGVVSSVLWIRYAQDAYRMQVHLTIPYFIRRANSNECTELTHILDNDWLGTSAEEEGFPIAFAISAYDSFERLTRLLRLIYRKHNIYCIHVDRKAKSEFRNNLKHLADCFGSNVFLVPEELSVDVRWGYFSVLQSTLLCAEQLVKQQSIDWRYMLNLNEKEFPLRTNWELVRALKNLNGSNIVEGLNGTRFKDRFPVKKLTFEVEWVKGSFLVALRQEFVNFIFTNPKAVEILDALKSEQHLMKVPDELFFSTLAYNPKLRAPGACLSLLPPNDSDSRSWFLARYVNWDQRNCPSGVAVRGVCILGLKDIPVLIKQPHLFANKFLPNFQPEAYTYMEQWYAHKVSLEKELEHLDPGFDERIYANLYCSRKHI